MELEEPNGTRGTKCYQKNQNSNLNKHVDVQVQI